MKFDKLERLVERAMLDEVPRKKKKTPSKKGGGQASERYLVAAVNHYVRIKGGSVSVKLGQLGKKKIYGAASVAGGANEPKADVAICLSEDCLQDPKSTNAVGVSMKLPNWGFLENWLSSLAMEKKLTGDMVGMPVLDAIKITEMLVEAAKSASKEQMDKIIEEEDAFKALSSKAIENEFERQKAIGVNWSETYDFPDPLNKKTAIPPRQGKQRSSKSKMPNAAGVIFTAMEQSDSNFDLGGLGSRFKIENVYVPMRKIMEKATGEVDAYENIVRVLVSGASGNPFPASAMLTADVPAALDKADSWRGKKLAASETQLLAILDQIQDTENVIKQYSNPNHTTQLVFRLRPITLTRTIYSTSNASKYRQGMGATSSKEAKQMKFGSEAGLWGSENGHISWLAMVTPSSKANADEQAQKAQPGVDVPGSGWDAYYQELVSLDDMSPEEQERAMRGGEEAAGYSQFEEHKTKHLTKTPGSYTMLSEMIQNLMSEE